MQTLYSNYVDLIPVSLPYKGRQMYMHSFDLANPVMAEGYEDYHDVVVSLCRSAGQIEGIAHMTVDEKIVTRGMSQRRPKAHVDGHYVPDLGIWKHGGWCHDGFERMSIIVAASAIGCKAYRGVFHGDPASDGDLEHIRSQLGQGEVLAPNMGYMLTSDCVHESMILPENTQRTFLRIALPVH